MTQKVAWIALAVVAVSIAAWQMLRPRPGTTTPDTAASATHWICDDPACGNQIDLTARQLEEWLQSQDKVRREADEFSRQIVLKCPRCGKFTLVGATKCPKHGTWLALLHLDGRAGLCPNCEKEGGG